MTLPLHPTTEQLEQWGCKIEDWKFAFVARDVSKNWCAAKYKKPEDHWVWRMKFYPDFHPRLRMKARTGER